MSKASKRINYLSAVWRLGSWDTSYAQVLADQINQPHVEQNKRTLPGQRIMLWAAIVLLIVAIIAVWLTGSFDWRQVFSGYRRR